MDLDADGRTDIISGSYHPGTLYIFRRNEDGTFARSEELKDDKGRPLNVGAAAHVHAADWNGDGKLDLLVGNIDGEVWFIPRTGDGLAFGEAEPLEDAAGEITVTGGDAGPHAVDWDGDGKLDLLVGTGSGQVMFYRNTAEEGPPQLERGKVLVPARQDPTDYSIPWGMRLKVHAVDYNGDGKLDLLAGDFRSEPEESADTRRYAELREKYDAMIGNYVEMSRKAGDGKLAPEELEQYQALRKEIMQVITEMQPLQQGANQLQGNVWVFLRQ